MKVGRTHLQTAITLSKQGRGQRILISEVVERIARVGVTRKGESLLPIHSQDQNRVRRGLRRVIMQEYRVKTKVQ